MKYNKIKWSKYIYESTHTATADDVSYVENSIGVKFPKDYLDVAVNYQGMTINGASISFNEQTESIGALYTFDKPDENENYCYTIIHQHAIGVRHDQPPLVIPFTDAGGSSSKFCFDYRESDTNPKIIFVDSDYEFDDEDAVFVLADSFTDFLEMIYEDE